MQTVEICREREFFLAQPQLARRKRGRTQRHQTRHRLAGTRDHDLLPRFRLLDDARELGLGTLRAQMGTLSPELFGGHAHSLAVSGRTVNEIGSEIRGS